MPTTNPPSTNTCDCWSARLIQKWSGYINRRYTNGNPSDINCYKYTPVNSCQEANGNRYYYGNIIFGTANAEGRCNADVKSLTKKVSGFGSPRKTFRTDGPTKLRGIQVEAGWPRKIKMCLDGSVDEMQRRGYISYAEISNPEDSDFVSCQVKNRLPDFCAGTTDSDEPIVVWMDVSDDDELSLPEGYDLVKDMVYTYDEELDVFVNAKEVDFINDNRFNDKFGMDNNIIALIAALFMFFVFGLIKCMKPKWKKGVYERIDSDFDDESTNISISANK